MALRPISPPSCGSIILRFSEGQPPFQILIHTDDPGRQLPQAATVPELFEAPV